MSDASRKAKIQAHVYVGPESESVNRETSAHLSICNNPDDLRWLCPPRRPPSAIPGCSGTSVSRLTDSLFALAFADWLPSSGSATTDCVEKREGTFNCSSSFNGGTENIDCMPPSEGLSCGDWWGCFKAPTSSWTELVALSCCRAAQPRQKLQAIRYAVLQKPARSLLTKYLLINIFNCQLKIWCLELLTLPL